MKKKKCEKQLVIVFIGVNKIVENQGEKYNNNSDQCGCKCLAKFDKPRTAKNIFIKACNIIKCNPEKRNKNETHEKTVVEFDWYINPKTLGFNYGFTVNKKHNPAYCGS